MPNSSEDGRDPMTGTGSRGKPFARDPRFKKLDQDPIASSRKADIWKVRDLGADPYVGGDRVVAVKVLKPGVGLDDRERLRREGDESRRIDHPNLVRILDCRGGPGSPYLVMEHIEGENLTKLLDGRRRPIAAERLVELAIQLCAALECLHHEGLIHRDVKPGNLMVAAPLDGEGPVRLKLVDLGIAIEFDRADGEKAGSEPYMSPEVLFDRRASRRSDVYGAGMVLYEMATGRRLESVSDPEHAAGHRFGALAPPHVVNGEVPLWLSNLIVRAIEVSPGTRFTDAEAMRAALEAGEVVEEEAPTMAVGDDDTATRVMPGEGSRPLAFRLLNTLPQWLRKKLPGLRRRPLRPLVPLLAGAGSRGDLDCVPLSADRGPGGDDALRASPLAINGGGPPDRQRDLVPARGLPPRGIRPRRSADAGKARPRAGGRRRVRPLVPPRSGSGRCSDRASSRLLPPSGAGARALARGPRAREPDGPGDPARRAPAGSAPTGRGGEVAHPSAPD